MIRLRFVLLVAFTTAACTGEAGPTGPAGPDGPEEPEGPGAFAPVGTTLTVADESLVFTERGARLLTTTVQDQKGDLMLSVAPPGRPRMRVSHR